MTNKERKAQLTRIRRVKRVRARVTGTAGRPRLAVYRTLKHMHVQLIDDTAKKTIVSASDRDVKSKKGLKPLEISRAVGVVVAEKAIAKKIEKIVFDRRDKKYHGRVKALAEGAREGGLKF